MSTTGTIFFALWMAITIYIYILFFRIAIEMIISFSRNYRAPKWFNSIAEVLFVVTDPPLRLFRRFIPPLQFSGVSLDLSVLVLFIVLNVIRVFIPLSAV